MRYIIDKYGGSLSDILNNRKWYNIHVIGALGKKRGEIFESNNDHTF